MIDSQSFDGKGLIKHNQLRKSYDSEWNEWTAVNVSMHWFAARKLHSKDEADQEMQDRKEIEKWLLLMLLPF